MKSLVRLLSCSWERCLRDGYFRKLQVSTKGIIKESRILIRDRNSGRYRQKTDNPRCKRMSPKEGYYVLVDKECGLDVLVIEAHNVEFRDVPNINTGVPISASMTEKKLRFTDLRSGDEMTGRFLGVYNGLKRNQQDKLRGALKEALIPPQGGGDGCGQELERRIGLTPRMVNQRTYEKNATRMLQMTLQEWSKEPPEATTSKQAKKKDADERKPAQKKRKRKPASASQESGAGTSTSPGTQVLAGEEEAAPQKSKTDDDDDDDDDDGKPLQKKRKRKPTSASQESKKPAADQDDARGDQGDAGGEQGDAGGDPKAASGEAGEAATTQEKDDELVLAAVGAITAAAEEEEEEEGKTNRGKSKAATPTAGRYRRPEALVKKIRDASSSPSNGQILEILDLHIMGVHRRLDRQRNNEAQILQMVRDMEAQTRATASTLKHLQRLVGPENRSRVLERRLELRWGSVAQVRKQCQENEQDLQDFLTCKFGEAPKTEGLGGRLIRGLLEEELYKRARFQESKGTAEGEEKATYLMGTAVVTLPRCFSAALYKYVEERVPGDPEPIKKKIRDALVDARKAYVIEAMKALLPAALGEDDWQVPLTRILVDGLDVKEGMGPPPDEKEPEKVAEFVSKYFNKATRSCEEKLGEGRIKWECAHKRKAALIRALKGKQKSGVFGDGWEKELRRAERLARGDDE